MGTYAPTPQMLGLREGVCESYLKQHHSLGALGDDLLAGWD
jgi:hypothetical protein